MLQARDKNTFESRSRWRTTNEVSLIIRGIFEHVVLRSKQVYFEHVAATGKNAITSNTNIQRVESICAHLKK